MSFSFSPGGQGEADPWFRIGRVDVSTTVLVVGLAITSMLVWAFQGLGGGDLIGALVLYPDAVMSGRVWQLVTWPLANGIGFWPVLTLFFLWYFGTELESSIGRTRMAWLLLGFTVSLSAAAMAVHLLLGSRILFGGLAGLGDLQLMVLLTWIGTHPTSRFIFNIPAWGFGLVIVAIQLLAPLGAGDWFRLLVMSAGLPLCAIWAKSLGLLGELRWVPALPGSPGSARTGHPAGRGTPRRTSSWRRRGKTRGAVTTLPWQGNAATATPRERDQARLDDLLDKISAGGLNSLSDRERAELMDLRDRLARE